MTALSDQSTMAVWPWWTWLLIAAVLFVLSLRRNKTPQRPSMPIRHVYEPCSTTGCHYQARTTVQSFTGPVRVCRGCADEGIAHGWFTAA